MLVKYYNLKMLTVDALYFSSQTGITTFRIGRVTCHKTFDCFFDTNVTANSIKMVIPSKAGLNYRFSVVQEPEL